MLTLYRTERQQQLANAWWIPVLLGLLCLLAVSGGRILDPSYDGWLMGGDPGQHLAGWRFYRHSPWLQFPLGANPAYGELVSSSIVYSDSIPLMALPFKLIGWALPESFQYFGLWIAACLILQAVFAWKLLARFIDDRIVLMLATCFFILSPSMLFRLHAHEALVAHWVLLAAIYLYLRPVQKTGSWLLLLGCTSLIHPYLLAMVLSLWLLDWLTVWLRWPGQVGRGRWLIEPLLVVCVLVFLMWIAGFGTTSGSASLGDFTRYKLNLLSLIDGDGMWSRFLPDQPGKFGAYEGFNYLGLGLLALGALLAAQYLVLGKRVAVPLRMVLPLLVLSVGLTAYALSNHISLGLKDVFTYSLPPVFDGLIGTFRVAGRFFWVVGYLLVIGMLYLFVRAFTCRNQRWLLAGLLTLQVVDMSAALEFNRARLTRVAAPVLVSSFWKEVPQQYGRVAYVVPVNEPPDYLPLALLAAANGMSINAANLARIDPAKLSVSQHLEIAAIANTRYDPKTVYVFLDDAFWRLAQSNARATDFVGVVDGYKILAPGWNGCVARCGLKNLAPAAGQDILPAGGYQLGDRIDFSATSQAQGRLFGDWSAAEGDRRWTDGTEAFVRLQLADPGEGGLMLRMDANAFLTPGHPKQTVEVLANGEAVGKLDFGPGDVPAAGIRELMIPRSAIGKNNVLMLMFRISHPTSPKQNGMGKDARALGMSIAWLTITAAVR